MLLTSSPVQKAATRTYSASDIWPFLSDPAVSTFQAALRMEPTTRFEFDSLNDVEPSRYESEDPYLGDRRFGSEWHSPTEETPG